MITRNSQKITKQSKQYNSKIAKLYTKYALPLMKFLMQRMEGDQIAAEEVLANTFLAVCYTYRTFQHKSQFFTWLCRIALNKIADYYRNQIHENSIFIAPTLEKLANIENNKQLSIQEIIALKELKTAVKECVKLLPPEKQQLLYLRYWQNMTIKKIAQIFGTSERSIEGKIYRSKNKLRQIIASRHPELISQY